MAYSVTSINLLDSDGIHYVRVFTNNMNMIKKSSIVGGVRVDPLKGMRDDRQYNYAQILLLFQLI